MSELPKVFWVHRNSLQDFPEVPLSFAANFAPLWHKISHD